MRYLVRLFSSLRMAIVLLILLAGASVIGTLIPQGLSAAEYAARYGRMGRLIVGLQMNQLYGSVLFLGLLAVFAANIGVCTFTRLSPRLRRVFKPRVETCPESLLSSAAKDRFQKDLSPDASRREVLMALSAHHYRTKELLKDNRIFLLARKKTAGWLGADIVHTGLLVIIAGGLISGLSGFKAELPLREGQIRQVPRAAFEVRLDKFDTELYPDGNVRDWKSTLTILEGGAPVRTKAVEVNHPLSHGGFKFYQSSYGRDWENPVIEMLVKKKSDPSFSRLLVLKVGEKAALDGKEGASVSAKRFIPDFVLDESKNPRTRSSEPNNPAVLAEIREGEDRVSIGWIFARFPEYSRMHGAQESDLSLELKDLSPGHYSVITAAKDPGVNFMWAGSILVMTGLLLAFFWPPREIKVVLEENQGKTRITAGGLSPKSREDFHTEFEKIMTQIRRSK